MNTDLSTVNLFDTSKENLQALHNICSELYLYNPTQTFPGSTEPAVNVIAKVFEETDFAYYNRVGNSKLK